MQSFQFHIVFSFLFLAALLLLATKCRRCVRLSHSSARAAYAVGSAILCGNCGHCSDGTNEQAGERARGCKAETEVQRGIEIERESEQDRDNLLCKLLLSFDCCESFVTQLRQLEKWIGKFAKSGENGKHTRHLTPSPLQPFPLLPQLNLDTNCCSPCVRASVCVCVCVIPLLSCDLTCWFMRFSHSSQKFPALALCVGVCACVCACVFACVLLLLGLRVPLLALVAPRLLSHGTLA